MTLKTLSHWFTFSRKLTNNASNSRILSGDLAIKRSVYEQALKAANIEQRKVLAEYERIKKQTL